jgi:Tn3 transposase DDE domain
MVHIEPVVEQLRAEGQRCDDELLSLTTPLLLRHLNPFGRYYFDLVRMHQDGGQLWSPVRTVSFRTRWSLTEVSVG